MLSFRQLGFAEYCNHDAQGLARTACRGPTRVVWLKDGSGLGCVYIKPHWEDEGAGRSDFGSGEDEQECTSMRRQ